MFVTQFEFGGGGIGIWEENPVIKSKLESKNRVVFQIARQTFSALSALVGFFVHAVNKPAADHAQKFFAEELNLVIMY